MKSILDKVFREEKFSVCIKDATGKVLMQNKICSGICGDYADKVCDIGCMALYAKDKSQQWQDWGSRVYKNSFVHNAYYDITLFCSDEYLITFLQPLKEKYEQALSYYKDINLTKREMQIVSCLVQGKSNPAIIGELSISKSTLKTHLNNLYRKVNDSGKAAKFLPHQRSSIQKAQ